MVVVVVGRGEGERVGEGQDRVAADGCARGAAAVAEATEGPDSGGLTRIGLVDSDRLTRICWLGWADLDWLARFGDSDWLTRIG